ARVVARVRGHPGADGGGDSAGQGHAHGGVRAGNGRRRMAGPAPAAASGTGRGHCRRGGRGRAGRNAQVKEGAMSGEPDSYVLGAIALLTLCSLLTRAGYFLFGDHLPLTDPVRRALRYAPVAALTAIIVP